jgi:transcriptional regulator with XRE-family HTH domain
MTTPDQMTGAELQTLREACGLTREALAELAQVQARTVKHWETRTGAAVPADVAAIVRRWARWVLKTSALELARIRYCLHMTTQGEPKAGDVVLIRYKSTSHLPMEDRQQDIGADAHGAMVARLMLDLECDGVPVRVVWFDPEKFSDWVTQAQGLPHGHDTPAARAAWAAQAIEAQAIPHPADQPPSDHTPGA